MEKLIWSVNHEKCKTRLYNSIVKIYPDADDDDFIEEYKDKLFDIIMKNDAWKNSSKQSFLFTIARWLNINSKNKSTVKKYQTAGYKLKLEREKNEGKNELDDNEKLYYKEHEYYIDLIKSIDKETIIDKTEHYKYLLLNLLVKQPPLRNSFYTNCKIIFDKEKNNNKDNYLFFNNKKVFYIVNNDKASNYVKFKKDKKLNFIEIIDKDLIELLNESYKKYPRKYLFEIRNYDISPQTILNWVRSITKIKKINIDMFRSSYITWFYKNNQVYNDREKLSIQMRNSIDTACRNYNKVIKSDIVIEDEKDKKIKELNMEIAKLKKEIENYKNSIKII